MEKLAEAVGKMQPGDEWRSENYFATMENDGTLAISPCPGGKSSIDAGILQEEGEVIPYKKKPETFSEWFEKGSFALENELITEMAWEASEKNRDILYAGLIEKVKIVVQLNEKCNLITEGNMISNLSKELDKIIAVLNSYQKEIENSNGTNP